MGILLAIAALIGASPLSARVIQVDIGGIVQPVSVGIVSAAMARAEAERAEAVILRLDTRGGLPEAAREIVDRISLSSVPVILWSGAGGALPVEAGDAAALVGAITAHGGGNEEAPNAEAVLRRLDGREIVRADGSRLTLRFGAGTAIETFRPGLRARILSAIADPNIALALVGLGAMGIYAECLAPGLVIPGVLGAILALPGVYALAMFPIGGVGVALLGAGMALLVFEARLATRGILTAGGAMALLPGAMFLIDTSDPSLRIRFGVALAVTLPFAVVTSFLFSTAARARRNKAVTGVAAMPQQQ